jgi:MFS family permease
MARDRNPSQRGEWQRWPLLVPSLAGMTLAAVHGYSLGVMMPLLEQEFGWSRAQISGGPVVISFVALLAGPLVGAAIDRFGPRRIALFGVPFFCVALALLSTATADILSWWLRWALLGVAAMFIGATVWTSSINSAFDRNRGKALAIALCGTGVATAVVPVLTHALIEAGGWRYAYLMLAGISALFALPLVFLFFRSTLDRVRTTHDRTEAKPISGVSAREGFVSPVFLKLAGAIVIFGISSLALTVNAVPVLRAKGFDAGTAASLAGLIGIGSICGRLIGGVLLDHFDAKKVAAACVLAPVLSAVLLLTLPGATGPAMVACLLLGLALGTEVDACAYLASRYFGMRSFGSLFGTINGLLLFATGLAPFAANLVYDLTKSYDPSLWALIPMCLASGLLFLALGTYPDFSEGKEAIA